MEAGLLKSVRGKGGGYMIAKDPAEVRAGDILRWREGSTAAVACEGIDNSCTRSDLCSTVKFWRGLDDVIEKYVDGVTLADLATVPEINFRHQAVGRTQFLKISRRVVAVYRGVVVQQRASCNITLIFANLHFNYTNAGRILCSPSIPLLWRA